MTAGPLRSAVLALVAGATVVTAHPGMQQPVFSSATRLVRLDVLVTQGNRPIGGLTERDFDVFDNGVKQAVTLVAVDPLPLDVVLALDMSRSIGTEELATLRTAARAAVGALDADDRVSVLTLGPTVALRSELTNDRARTLAALESSSVSGDTALIDAMQAALAVAGAGAGRSLIIVFTDGDDTSSFLTAESVLTTAGGQAAVVYGVTTNVAPFGSFLRDLTRQTGGRLLPLRNMRQLERTLLDVFEEFRHRYVVGYEPRGVDRRGWHKVEVRVRRPGADVTTRPGYFGPR